MKGEKILLALVLAGVAAAVPAAYAQSIAVQPSALGQVWTASDLRVLITDGSANSDPRIRDSFAATVSVEAASKSHVNKTEIALVETGSDTGVFEVTARTSAIPSTSALQVSTGDTVTFSYSDSFPAVRGKGVELAKEFSARAMIGPVGVTCSATVSRPALVDESSAIKPISAGQKVFITANVVNNAGRPTPFVAIVEVRDASGYTGLLQWQSGTLAATGETGIGVPWTPDQAGDYQVRTFVVTGLDSPAALSDVATSSFTIS